MDHVFSHSINLFEDYKGKALGNKVFIISLPSHLFINNSLIKRREICLNGRRMVPRGEVGRGNVPIMLKRGD